MLTPARHGLCFDEGAFERALKAADFDRCRQFVDGNGSVAGRLAGARLAMRERRYVDVIGLLSEFADAGDEDRMARDVLLGAALGYTRDYLSGRRLIERALSELLPGDPLYDEGYYYKAAIAWMQHEHREAEDASEVQLRSSDANNRARAHIMLSWVALRRGDVMRQVDELQKALDEIDAADSPTSISAPTLF